MPELDEADSVALLAYFVPQLVKTEPENIQKLVQAVGGLPLALNLMGSYLSGQAYSNQPRRIDKALKKLRDVEERLQLQEKKGARDRHPSLPNRKTISLQAVIEISDEALQENERQALRAFSIFPPKPNTFSEKAALEVATTSGESLDLLVDVGLVEVGGQGRYMLHQTIADYASVRRTDETVGKRMAEYFAGYVDIQSKTSERELEVDEANIDQALELAHNNGYNELVILLCLGMQDFWHNHGRVERSQRYLPWGREAVEAVSSVTQRPEDRQRQADLTLAYGRLLRRVGELDEAIRVFEVNRAIRHEMQDLQGEGIVLGYISRITHTRGRIKEAEEYCQRALAIHREIGNRKEEGVDLSSLGQIAQTRGDFEEAQRYYEQSLVIRREMGVRRGEGMDLCFLGMVKLALGQQEDAERDYNQSLEIFLEEHEQAYEGVVRSELGYLAYLRGQLDDAEPYYQEAEKIVRKGQDPLTQCVLFPRMAALAASKGELEKAKELYREGLEVSRKSEYAPNIADALLALGSFLVEKMGKREEGCPMLLEAAQRYRAMGILREKEARERYRQLGCNP